MSQKVFFHLVWSPEHQKFKFTVAVDDLERVRLMDRKSIVNLIEIIRRPDDKFKLIGIDIGVDKPQRHRLAEYLELVLDSPVDRS